MSLNANALVTVEELRAYAGEKSTESDSLLEIIVNSVSQEFDRFCGRVLKQATYTNLYLDGSGTSEQLLPSWPAASITGVYEDDTLLTEGLEEDYVIYTSDEDAYLRKVNSTWPELDEETAVWLAGPKTIKIASVKLGYATIPADMKLACLKQAAREYQNMKQKAWGETSRSKGEDSASMVEPGLLPDVVAVLKRYRRMSL
jgi:hypothetical protein